MTVQFDTYRPDIAPVKVVQVTRENLVEVAALLNDVIPYGARVLGDDIVYDDISIAATVGEYVIFDGVEWLDTVDEKGLAKRYVKTDD